MNIYFLILIGYLLVSGLSVGTLIALMSAYPDGGFDTVAAWFATVSILIAIVGLIIGGLIRWKQ